MLEGGVFCGSLFEANPLKDKLNFRGIFCGLNIRKFHLSCVPDSVKLTNVILSRFIR